ncbi:DUF1203 domain-containing protein [Streptomyces sp. NBC_01808]|uniref:DUF1203 domain-containing protein n=1 Tax=Streptomyces sp. NBC_01808 TaxID=2975947 RepID=UPI002DD92573|nr:DUF1203 domain-containing protein [Streptomyces sp. NBC_01808]WSA37852.1 DUF1203 domain-containing protein [Streptomyces sp. NBC_01808]
MTTTSETPAAYRAAPIPPAVLARLREADDAGRTARAVTDGEGGAPLRCCLRRSRAGERIALVSYAPLRRWAAAAGVDPGAYDEQGPVFVHAGECAGPGPGGGYPFAETAALRAFRRYDAGGRIVGGAALRLPEDPAEAEAATGRALAAAFAASEVAFVHVRAVEYGCFLYEVRRP